MKYCTVCNGKFDDGVSFCPTDGEVLENDPTTIVGTNLDGQYRVEALLGVGGMGAVYKAHHIMLGDQVAIKIMPPQMRTNAEWLRRFRREGQAARRFRHPNSVTVYDLRTTADGLIYMVMEYVEGHTLDAELKRRGRFSPMDAFATLEPIMSVLNAAHAVGVVHRDLKPENIMIGKSGDDGSRTTKLLDLGIAKMREIAGSETSTGAALTVAGQILGTPFYMSPEQWGEMPRDGNPEIDGRADIYSLGAVFYELVSGHRPFEAATLQEIRRVHVFVSPPALSQTVPGVSHAFSDAIMRAMAKDRGDRPATMEGFANELRSALGLPSIQKQTGSLGSANVPEGDASLSSNSLRDAATITASNIQQPIHSTQSDVSAPTMLTMDSDTGDETTLVKESVSGTPLPQTSVSRSPEEAVPAPQKRVVTGAPPTQVHVVRQTSTGQAPAGPVGYAASEGQSQSVSPQPAVAAGSRPKKGLLLIPIVAIVLLLVVAAAGTGAWFLWRQKEATPPVTTKNTKSQAPTETSGGSHDMLHFWVEPTKSSSGARGSRLTEDISLNSGDEFRFHFVPQESGFLYIVGRGPNNLPTTFLTAKPLPETGVKTNSVASGSDFEFPQKGSIGLDAKPGTEVYTVIFSSKQLSEPGFLQAIAGQDLKGQELSDFNSFITRYSANKPEVNVNKEDQNAPFMSIRASGATASDPLVFRIQVAHK